MSEELRKLKVFFIEDNPDDVELEVHELRKGGFDVVYEAAKNRNEFLEKLPNINADIIIADYSLPDITGIEAIHICQEKKVDIPIIFITGAGDERIAVDSLREGAIDYILKKNIMGFSARISRALNIWANCKAKERAEAEKQKFQELFFQAQKMESIGRLASSVAHDFNNITTGILGLADVILRDTPSDSQNYKGLQTIISLCHKGASLTKQLLLFGRKAPVEFKKTDINSFIKENLNLLHHAAGKDIEIKLSFQENIPEIKADTGHLTRILMNLALNSRDAMGGKGIIEFRTEKSHAARPDGKRGEYICLSVSDSGCGISNENIPKIFDPFFTTKEAGKGTGLGLSIVYTIVNAHGGWIDVNSKLGKGTTFNIYLPASY